jgi:hypothetical protein
MRQFDVCRLKARSDQLVVILQHDTVDGLDTRVVAPLSPVPYRRLMERVRIPVRLDEGEYVVQLDRMAAISVREIGQVRGRLGDYEQTVKNGIDLLLFGV